MSGKPGLQQGEKVPQTYALGLSFNKSQALTGT